MLPFRTVADFAGQRLKDRTMRNGWFISGMLLWGMLLGAAPAQSREPAAVRVMTYNIQYGNGASSLRGDRSADPGTKPGFRRTAGGRLQNAPQYVSRQHGRDFITELGQLTGMFRFTARRFRLPEVWHWHPELTALYPHGKDHASQADAGMKRPVHCCWPKWSSAM